MQTLKGGSKMRKHTSVLIWALISFAFLVSCSTEPKFERFGVWIQIQNKKVEIPKKEFNALFIGTNVLKKDAIGISLNEKDDPTLYYYGDIPVSAFSFQEIHDNKDIDISVDIIPLKQSGAFKIIPKTKLKSGEYYTFQNGKFGYTIYCR